MVPGPRESAMGVRAVPVLAILLAAGQMASIAPLRAGDAGGLLHVGVSVRPSRPAPHALATLPLPPGAQALTSHRFGGSYRYAGAVAQATDFYASAMPQLGYRLAVNRHVDDAATQVWLRTGERVELEFRQTLGTAASTRIVVTAGATTDA